MGGKLLEKRESAIKLQFTLASGEKPSVSVRKGRNRNILVAVENATAAKRLASLESPFSVFSPGLAGVSKTEQYVSDGVLLRTIARGDANLVLRNILLRLWDTQEWSGFLSDLREIFRELEFQVDFKKKTAEFISVQVRVGKEWIPLELVGAGVLQATQILSYIHRFSPSIVVLDEPDSHLHPNNQRLLCALLRRVAEERGTQILLTTHSRHVVDAIGGVTKFLWVRNGTVESAGADDEIGVLLDIGALDVKERAARPGTKASVLTEDESTRPLEALLESSGFVMGETVILPYYGISTIKQLRPLVRMISGINTDAKIVVHRDRDYLTDDEAREWEESVRSFGVEPFVTTGVDIESHFLEPRHLAAVNSGRSEVDFCRLIDTARLACKDISVQHYVNGRIDIERSKGTHASINHGKLAVEAAKAVESDPVGRSHGKTILKWIRSEYQKEYLSNLQDTVPSEHASLNSLATIAKKTFRSRSKQTT
jgi:energy-coupling factor transporter ATP-binding protein EcfA2